MKIVITAFIFFSFIPSAKSQVIDYFSSNEKANDTLADLRYFKNVDKSIEQRLDLFFNFVKTVKDKDTSGFLAFSLLRNNSNKIIADISINSQYSDYRIFTAENEYGKVFGFTWYKSKLILFTVDFPIKFRIKQEYGSLLHDLFYPEMKESVRIEIDKKSERYAINTRRIGKRYYLD